MTKLIYKVGTAAATVALLASTFAGAAFATSHVNGGGDGSGNGTNGASCKIKGNGKYSTNICVIVQKKETLVVKKNKAYVKNVAVAYASTGGNSADNNTGGSVTVTSGNATASATITNTVNQTN